MNKPTETQGMRDLLITDDPLELMQLLADDGWIVVLKCKPAKEEWIAEGVYFKVGNWACEVSDTTGFREMTFAIHQDPMEAVKIVYEKLLNRKP